MKFKPDAVMRAIRIAQAIGSKIDPSFATIPMPKAGEGVPLERSSGGTARDVRMPMHYPARMADGGTPPDFKVNNAMSVFPKPQRMWDDQRPGGAYLSMPDQRDITGHKAAQASIGIGEGGKPYFHASRDEVDETGTPGKGSALVKTNLFKQKAGWKWKDAPEGHENTSTIVSVEHRGNHHYVLGAHFPNGVDLSRYPDATSEPRLRPTTRGNVELGPQVGSILVRGREHPVHSHAIVREYGGRVGYADGGSDDDDQEITGYHGSANEFPEFSMAARGRGQRQAAFGEGHNFAEDEDVARAYREMTAREYGEGDVVHRRTGEALPNDAPEVEILKDASRNDGDLGYKIRSGWPNLISHLEKQIEDAEKDRSQINDDDWLDEYIQERRDKIENYKRAIEIGKTHRFEPKGHMYEVGLRLNPNKLLKWHEPVEAQPEAVQRYLAENGIEPKDDWVGRNIYYRLSDHPDMESKFLSSEGHSGKFANQILHGLGVHGIQWKDTDSRIAPGRGKNNYTIWDDSRIKVRKRYALGGSDDDSRDLNEFGLYSHAAEQALGLQRTDTPENYKQMLLKRGVKPAEFDWSGYDKAFADQPQVTREQVSGHFENNIPEVFETQYGIDPKRYERQEMRDRHSQEYIDYIRKSKKNGEDAYTNTPEFKEMIERQSKEKREFGHNPYYDEPFHGSYTIPGGENYREILARNGNENYNFPGVGSHFGGEGNILASLRLKDRKDNEGDNVLHLEELQSDWGQNARKHGIKDDDRIFNARMRYLKSKDATREAQESEDAYKIMEAEKERREAVEEFNSAINGVENAPYIGKTDDWVDFGLKRALLEAAKGGQNGDYHKLAWSPGDVQANRYDLSKHIGEIRHSANENGTYDIEVYSPNGKFLTAKNDMEGHELPNLIGKELSDKIFSGEGESVDNGKNNSNRDWRSLSGLDLKVGGEGMRKFYDQMLPKRLLRLARMHDPDARLVSSEVEHPATYDYRAKSTQLPALEITPKMRASILKKGFPAYADGGEVDGYDDGGSVGGHPLTNPVYHGVKSDSVSSPIASGLGMEMFDRENPGTLEDPQDKAKFFWKKPNRTALMLGPHVSRDPNIAGDARFTTGEYTNDSGKRVGARAQGKVMPLNTFSDEKFFPVEQKFDRHGNAGPASYDDQAVHNTVYADIMQNNPKLAHEILTERGMDEDLIHSLLQGFQSGQPFDDPLSTQGFKWNNAKHYLDNTSRINPSPRLAKKAVMDFRKRMRDRGYVGLSYINTDEEETSRNEKPDEQIEDKKCYIVFPQRDKETGWYPLRFKHGAAYNPEDKGKPGLHLATGGGAGDMEDNQPPSAYFEVAPGKTWDAGQQQSWEQLHPQAKAAVSNKMIGEYLSRWQRETGIHGEVRPGLGGFEGDTNPNYTFHPYDPAHIQPALHGLGTLFRQDAMMGAHTKPFPGSFPAGVVRVNLPKGMSEGQAHALYTKLNQKTFKGDDGEEKSLADGHSTSLENGTMDILHGSHEESIRAGRKINALLKGKHVIEAFPTNISFPEHGAEYGLPHQGSGSPQSSAPQAHNPLQAEAAARLAELLAEAHRQGGGHKGPVSFGDTLAPGQPHPDTVSAMMPMTASSYKGPPLPGQARNDISPSQHSPEALSAIYSRMWKQHPASGGEELPADEAKEKLLDLYTKNLLGVWDRTPPAQRQTSRFWYRAAHALGNAYAEHHDIMPRAAHAIMAVLSPQNPWDKNVTQAERVMDILKNRQDQPWTQGMSEVAYTGGSSGKGLPHDKGVIATGPHNWADIEGKTLREVLAGPHGQKKAAMWIRAFDEAHNPTEYRAVSPTGEFLGTQMNKSGKAPDTASWNSYSPIAKAISIWHDPSLENINQQVGTNHKVREFYNNITNPNDPNVVVGDTHAVAAGEFLPHGSASKAVLHNFGSAPDTKGKQTLENEGTPWGEDDVTRSTGATGARGDYPIHAESVRRAAWQRGVHPSEMQSVTWETVRTIFKNKSTPMKRAARAIWGEYANGNLSHSETMDKIIDLATGGKGLTKPTWGSQSGQGIGNVSVGSYVKPGEIPAESPANKRYKSSGGAIDKAILVAMRAKKRSPIAIK